MTLSYLLKDPTGVPIEMPRSKWTDILRVLGYPTIEIVPVSSLLGAPAKAAQVYLQEAMRLLNLGHFDEAAVTARKALEEVRSVTRSIRPNKTDTDYRQEDLGTRIGRVAWSASNFCNAAAHPQKRAGFKRAEALLAIRQAAALLEYAGAPPDARGADLTAGPAVEPAMIEADYEGA
jgi:hypothetical protein